VTFWADGGGKVRGAALQAVHGRANVARFVIAVTARFTPQGARFDVADVNGRSALLIRHADGAPAIVVSIGVSQAGIDNIWVIANPDKLKAVRISPP
jgi:RNA polymerase sigma-70 factor (ECF subfamily)